MKIKIIILKLIIILFTLNSSIAEEIPVDAFNCGIIGGGIYIREAQCPPLPYISGLEFSSHFYPTIQEASDAAIASGQPNQPNHWDEWIADQTKFNCFANGWNQSICEGQAYNYVRVFYCYPLSGADCDGEPLYNEPLADTDGDTITDDRDKCPDTEMNNPTGDYGCSVEQDGDGDVDYGTTPCIEECREPVALGMSEKLDPIKLYNGNNFQEETDLRLPSPMTGGFHFIRYYNSRSTENSSVGYGWNHNFNTRLVPNYRSDATQLKIIDETGKGVYFHQDGADHFVAVFMERSTIDVINGNYVWNRRNGFTNTFDSNGFLVAIEDKKGSLQVLTYDSNDRLSVVVDESSERQLTFQYNSSGLLETITGPVTDAIPSGIWVSLSYTDENLTSVTYSDGSGLDYSYGDPHDIHNLTRKADKQGHILSSWGYDDLDRAISNATRDGRGGTINYVNDTTVEVTDAYNKTRTYTISDLYGGRKRVVMVSGDAGCESCDGNVVQLYYNQDLTNRARQYANGRFDHRSDYDSQGRPKTKYFDSIYNSEDGTFTAARTIFDTYDETNHPELNLLLTRTEKSTIDDGTGSRNKITIRDYDNDYNAIPNENPTPLLSRIIEKGFTVDNSGSVIPYEYITTYRYNSKGQIESIDGPLLGNQDTVTMTYDPATGNLLTVSQPLIGTITYANYDAAGNPGSITDESQIITNFTYDGRNRIASKEIEGVTTNLNYNLAGNIDSITDGAGRSFTYSYSSTYGLLERVTDPLGNSLRYAYDDKGNRIEDSSYNAQNIRQLYMRFDYHGPQIPGRLWKMINPDDTEKVFSYDQMGNVSMVVDELNNATNYSYDLLNRLTTVTQPESVVTGYGYDSHNNLDSVTDAENHATSYVYDDLKRQVSVTSPDTGTTAYAYDAAGNLVSKSDANGITATYTYDALNRLTVIHYPDSAQDITYSYDAGANGMGRLTGMTDQSGSYAYSYDVFGNLVSEEKTIEGVTYTTGYDYDPTGVLTKITYPDGREVNYTLDNAGRVAEIATTSDSITKTVAQNINYLPFGPAAGLTYGNGTQVTKTFDQRYQVTALSAGNIQSLNYTIGATGNITAITDNLDPNRNQTFGYDNLYRLTSAGGIYGTASYTYDKVGNRLTKTLNSETDNYTYTPESNRLGNITGANPQNFAYDANGNMTAKESKTLTYNQNNRLIQVAENSIVSGEYTYNGNGQRVKKITDGITTIYHYDLTGNLIAETEEAGGHPIKEYIYLNEMLLATVEYNNTTPPPPPGGFRSLNKYRLNPEFSQGTVIAKSINSLLDFLVQPVFAQDLESKIYYFITDHLGTPQKIMDENSAVVWSADYMPFGEADVYVNTYENNFRFPGQYYDSEIGLHYNYHRYYDPETGRYLNTDPIGLAGGINPFLYSWANPINFIDPLGLRIQLMGTPEQQQYTLNQLRLFTRGDLSIGKNGTIARTSCENDEGIESDIDELINSPDLYRIHPYLPDDSGFGRSHTVPRTEGGADIYFDPNVDTPYSTGFLRSSPSTPGSELAHEILGRATQIEKDIPHGRMGSSTRRRSNDRAVEKANPAYIRMGMKPRTSYNR